MTWHITLAVCFMFSLKEPELMWRYADFVLSRDEEIGVGIFTLQSISQPISDVMKPDTIVDYLHQYPKAVVKYLEHLVLEKNIEVYSIQKYF